MSESILHDLPGGAALFAWFGRVPNFHDAQLVEMTVATTGPSRLRLRTWRMTDQVDAQGYFILDRHVAVTVLLEGVTAVSCTDFDLVPGIVFSLEISRVQERYRVAWDASYGVEGSITAKRLRFELQPGEA